MSANLAIAALGATCLLAVTAAAEPLGFRTIWDGADGEPGGETPMEIGPVAHGAVAWIGRYPFGRGALYGCFDAQSGVFEGVWTQTDFSYACDASRYGAAIWGEVRFEFDAELRRFDGWWNACGEPERFGWRGVRDDGLGRVEGGAFYDFPDCAAEPLS